MERKQFYKTLKSFLKELVIVFPDEDEDIQIVTTTLNLAIIDDTGKIIEKFHKALLPLENELLNCDISLFDKIVWERSTLEYRLFYRIKSRWDTFSENNKTVIWEYITLLYRVSREYFLR